MTVGRSEGKVETELEKTFEEVIDVEDKKSSSSILEKFSL